MRYWLLGRVEALFGVSAFCSVKLQRSVIPFWAALAAVLVVWDGGAKRVFAMPARVILLRHAEKPEDDNNIHLSAQGKLRAHALVAFFADRLGVSTTNPPSALFAARPSRGAPSVRTQETLKPLAAALNLPILKPDHADGFAVLAKHVLEDPKFDGKTVIVCWTHNELGDFARALGAKPKPKEWSPSVYDRVWEITFEKKIRCRTVLQRLLPSDTSEGD